jgi:uncharacterized repeat protein (TIGR01451 family)
VSKRTRKHLLSGEVLLILALLLSLSPLLTPAAVRAQEPDGPRKAVEFELPADPTGRALDGELREIIPAGTDPLLYNLSKLGVVNIIVELEAPAAIEAAAAAGLSQAQMAAAAEAQVARVKGSQQAMLGALTAAGLNYQLVASSQRVLNALIVRADASQLAAMRSLPGVKAAYPERIAELDNSTSVPFVGAPALWSLGGGFTGEGIAIGIIDSGIDYDHVNFGGDGDGVPEAAEFPTAKIAGGYDFVGDTWHPVSSPALVPDADPYDQNGHGSHVAGTAAGYGVVGGATYGGAYDAGTPFTTMDIGPGVAPGATIYAYKIGSVSNYVSEAAAILALEQAVLDGVDVVNMSVGGNFGDPNIGWAVAADNASIAGIVVVSSAGNAGDTYFIQGDPATADWAIAVAASVDGSLGIEVVGPEGSPLLGVYEALSASFGPAVYDVTGLLELANDGVGPVTNGCEPLVGFTAGNIALIDRGGCPFVTKVANAQAAGATGVLIANTATQAMTSLGGSDPTITIPSVMITYADGQALRGAGVTVHMANDIVFGDSADTLFTFSSRGPQREPLGANVGLKPDIAAPGSGITSTALGTGSGAVDYSGTSMASPHVAGAVALLRQLHPGWSVAEIKALVMNTATHHLYQGNNQTPPIYGPARAGVGRLDVANASSNEVIAYNAAAPELVSVSFGIIDAAAPATHARSITVENKGQTSASFEVSYVPLADIDGVLYTVSPASVTVGANSTATVQVTLNIIAHATWTAPHSHDPTVAETQNGFPRHWLSEESGLVRLAGAESELWVPVYAAVRPSATLQATTDPLALAGTTGVDFIEMAGTAVSTGGALPYAELSLVSAFELYGESEDDAFSTDVYDSGDLQYIGVTSDYNAVRNLGGTLYANSRLYFGLSTYGNWSSLSEEVWFEVYIDADQDGFADYRLWNWNLGAAVFGASSDVFIVIVDDFGAETSSWYGDYVNDLPASAINTAPFQNSVLFMGTRAGRLGLDDTDATFDFFVASWYLDGTLVDVSEVMTYNMLAQGVDFSTDGTNDYTGAPLWQDQVGAAVPVRYDWDVYEGPTPACVLLLHHHNLPALRAETVCLQAVLTHDVGVTKTVDNPYPDELESVVYTITAINNSPDYPVTATVQDLLPADLQVVSHSASQGTYDPISGEWAVGDVLPGGSATLEISAYPREGTHGQTITNTATITGSAGEDTNPADNSASVDILVGGPPGEPGDGLAGAAALGLFDPALSKVGVLQAGEIGLPGEQLTWTITLTNTGTATATDVPVVDTLPATLRVDSATTSKGTVTIAGQTVTFLIDSIAPGETVQMQIVTTVISSPLDGLFVNEAIIAVPDGAGGTTILARARATVAGVSVLPSTGYPPQ